VIANKCPAIEVTVVDLNADRIKAWHTNHLPIYEPGLPEVLRPARDGVPGVRKPNLFFATDVQHAIAKADLIFLCVPTPTKDTGIGAGRAADMSCVEAAARMIADVAKDDKIVVEKSTVPCRTAEAISRILAAVGKPGVNFDILSNPEFLAEGTAIKDLLEPDRVLIGSLQTDRGLKAAAALSDVYGSWVPHERVITMSLWSSEMAKLSANALLAQRISSINALSAVCEVTGADIDEVSYACGLDSRIGPRMLKPSVGFGGSCYRKDVLSLVYIAESHNLPEVAAYWKGVVDINEYQKDRFIKRIVKCLFSTLTNKKVAILGYAYKKDTGDTRESAAISIVNHLVRESAEVSIYDPKVEEMQVWQSLEKSNDKIAFDVIKSHVTVCRTPYEACKDADAVVIATEWDEFSNKASNGIPTPIPTLTVTPTPTPTPIPVPNPFSTSMPTPTPTPSPSSTLTPTLSPNAPQWAPGTTNQFQIPAKNNSGALPIKDPRTGSVLTFDKPRSPTALPGKSQYPPNSFSTTSQMFKSTRPTATLMNVSHHPSHDPPIATTSEPLTSNENSKDDPASRSPVDWNHIARIMRRPMFVFDGRNVVDAERLRQLGFCVEGIGKPSVDGQNS